MKISEKKLDIALAKKCMSLTDLRSDFSSCTLYRVKNGEALDVDGLPVDE